MSSDAADDGFPDVQCTWPAIECVCAEGIKREASRAAYIKCAEIAEKESDVWWEGGWWENDGATAADRLASLYRQMAEGGE